MYFAHSTLAAACLILLVKGQHDGKYTSSEENDSKESDKDVNNSLIENHSFIALIDIVFTDYSKKSCTGSIIHDYVVLTAAHCFTGSNKNAKPELTASFVVIGTKTMFDTGYEQYLPIERIMIHPKFKGWTADLALVYTFAGMTSDKPGTVIPLAGEKTWAHVDANVTLLSWVHTSPNVTIQPYSEDSSCDSSSEEGEVSTKYSDNSEHDSGGSSTSIEEVNGRTQAYRNKKKKATVPMYRLLREGSNNVREEISQLLIEKKHSDKNTSPIIRNKEHIKVTVGQKVQNYDSQKKFDPGLEDEGQPMKGHNHFHNGSERSNAVKYSIIHKKRSSETSEQLYTEKSVHQQRSKIKADHQIKEDIESSENEEGLGLHLNNPISYKKRQGKHSEPENLPKHNVYHHNSKTKTELKKLDLKKSETEEEALKKLSHYLNVSERIRSELESANYIKKKSQIQERPHLDNFFYKKEKETFSSSPNYNNHTIMLQRFNKKSEDEETEDYESSGTEKEEKTVMPITKGRSRYLNERISFEKGTNYTGSEPFISSHQKRKSRTSRRLSKSTTTATDKNLDSLEHAKNADDVETYVQKIKPQLLKFKSYFKNWRRTMGSQQNQLKVESFGFVSLQQCQALVEKATSILGEHDISKTKDVVCYASRDSYVITDADSGAPAIRHGELVAVTVGGAEFEGDHVAVGMKMSCYCSWIADNLPNGGDNNMNCCKNCCQIKHKEPHREPKNKDEEYNDENQNDETHQNEKHKKVKHRFRAKTLKHFPSRYFLDFL